jgi:CheY-like chemotaxis protein
VTAALERPRPVVLIADDDPDILELAFRLERAGYEIVRASDGEEALQLATERVPDLAVLDVTMPKLTG